MKRNLLLTYDYELFLGSQSGSVDNCLIKPTNKLLAIMKEVSVKAIFFVDSVYLMRLKEQAKTHHSCALDFSRISLQITEMITLGHYVYPHIHPHWLDAVYLPEKNEWNLEKINRYRFCNITQQDKEYVFNGSVEILREIIHPVDPGYCIDAHRAGGWSVQPFTDFEPFYIRHQFRYDFSVLDKAYMFTKAQYFDFSAIPNKNIYRFNDDVTLEVSGGKYYELVNSTYVIHPVVKFFDRILLKVLYKVANDYSYGRGAGQIAVRINSAIPHSSKGYDMTDTNYAYISVEQLSFIKFRSYMHFLKKQDFMQFVSHPKMVTKHNLSTFSRFLKRICRLYSIESDFKKMI